MLLSRCEASSRPGAIAPLTAFLLVPLVAMVAFAVDMGWITHTQNELQSAADAAALAGAGQLPDGFVAYYLPAQSAATKQATLTVCTAKASTYAKQYAGSNSAGDASSLTLLDSDIEYGFTDAAGNYTAIPAYQGYPNTVKVVLRRDGSANTPLGLFFAKVLNIQSVNLTATASASLYAGSIDGFRNPTTTNSRILPMTYDVNHWNSFLKTGKSPDNVMALDSNGLPQLNIYPSIKFTGNFGELSLDQGNDGASTISNWLNNGVPSVDLQTEYALGLLPLSKHDSSSPDWKGNPGLKNSTIQTAGDNVDGLYLLPLFKPVNDGVLNPDAYAAGTGQGSNYNYTIVAFVGVRITSVDSQGGSKAINVQPSALIDPNALYSTLAPASPPTATTTLTTTFSYPKLTR